MPGPPDTPELPDVAVAIRRRRTARRFDPERAIPGPVLDGLIELATLAPAPLPLQPARFVLVRSAGNLRKLRGCTFGDARLTEAPAVVIVLGYLDPPRTDLAPLLDFRLGAEAIAPAEAARLAATVPRTWRDLGDSAASASRAGMMAAATLVHAAEGLGLASAWIEVFNREKVRAGFGIPDDHAVVALVALGYLAGPHPPFPGRLPIDDILSHEHFGQPRPAADPP